MYFILSWKCCQLEGIFLLGYSIRWWIIGIKKWPLYVQESHTWFSCSIKRIFSSGNIEIRLCFVLPITSWGYVLCFLLVGRWILYPCPCERICLTFGADEYSLCLDLFCRTTKIYMQKKLPLSGKESGKECFLFQGLLPQMRYKMKWWTHRWLTSAMEATNFIKVYPFFCLFYIGAAVGVLIPPTRIKWIWTETANFSPHCFSSQEFEFSGNWWILEAPRDYGFWWRHFPVYWPGVEYLDANVG